MWVQVKQSKGGEVELGMQLMQEGPRREVRHAATAVVVHVRVKIRKQLCSGGNVIAIASVR